MQKDYLILRRASASRPSGEWNDDDFDVLADGEAVGRIFNANAAPVGSPWMWTLAFGQHHRAAGHWLVSLPGSIRHRQPLPLGACSEHQLKLFECNSVAQVDPPLR